MVQSGIVGAHRGRGRAPDEGNTKLGYHGIYLTREKIGKAKEYYQNRLEMENHPFTSERF